MSSVLYGLGVRHAVIVLACFSVLQLCFELFALAAGHDLHSGAMLAEMILHFVMIAIAILSAVAVDSLLGGALGPARRLAVAVLVASMASTAMMEAAIHLVIELLGLPLGEPYVEMFGGEAHRMAFLFAGAASWSLVLIALYTMLEASRSAAEELHMMRAASLAAESAVLEEDLRGMQARVDPELLFDSLLEVDQAYGRDVDAGREALDAPIRFLRAALPEDAATVPKVAREQELGEAYLAVVAGRAGWSFDLEISVAPDARNLPMPAMLLLPMVRWAAFNGDLATTARIVVRREPVMLDISVETDSAQVPGSPTCDIESVRERLGKLFPGRAGFDASVQGRARQARLRIPLGWDDARAPAT